MQRVNPSQSETPPYQFYLPDITCINCIQPIINGLMKDECKGVKVLNAEADVVAKTIKITVEQSGRAPIIEKEILKRYINDEKYVTCTEVPEKPKILMHIIKGVIGLVTGAAIIALMLTGVGIPLAAMLAIGAISTALTIFLGWDSYVDAVKQLSQKNLTMDTLFSISTIVAIGVSIASFFVPILPMLFDAALLIFGFRHIGRAVQESFKEKVNEDLTFCSTLPKKVKVLVGPEQLEERPLNAINPGDVIVISPGEIIPVDGECISESAKINAKSMTGQNNTRVLKKGDTLYQGMVVNSTKECLTMKVTAPYYESYLAKEDEKIAKAFDAKKNVGKYQQITQKILQYFIPGVLILSVLSLVLVGIFFPPALAITCAIAVLVFACPCTLGLVVPMAESIGKAKAAQEGIHFKDGESLETAHNIDTVAFDLNGTLTKGQHEVTKVILADSSVSELKVKSRLQQLEGALQKTIDDENSSHQTNVKMNGIGQAILAYCKKNKTERLAEEAVTQLDKSFYAGISGIIDGKEYVLGNGKILAKYNIPLSSESSLGINEQIVYLAEDKKIIAKIILKDELREDAIETIAKLQQQKKKVIMITGAKKETAYAYAKQTNIPLDDEHIIAECMDKEKEIIRLQTEGKCVAMVGDAENDASAIARSDLGVAVADGHDVTTRCAKVIIKSKSMLPLVGMFEVADQTVANIKQSLGASLIYNTGTLTLYTALLLTLNIVLSPAIGAAMMVVQAGLVFLNAIRFKFQKLTYQEKVPASPDNGEDFGSTLGLFKAPGMMPPKDDLVQEERLENQGAARVAEEKKSVVLSEVRVEDYVKKKYSFNS